MIIVFVGTSSKWMGCLDVPVDIEPVNDLTGIWYMTTSKCATCHYADCKSQVSYAK